MFIISNSALIKSCRSERQLQETMGRIFTETGWINIRISPSNIIPMSAETWDVQETDGRCEVGTDQGPNP